MTTQSTGKLGEDIVSAYIQKLGYTLLDRNYRSKRWGELDLIAIDNDQLVFIEVKTRIGEQQTTAIESITPHKLRSLTRAAYFYIRSSQHAALPQMYRIDIITVEFSSALSDPTVNHYKNVYIK